MDLQFEIVAISGLVVFFTIIGAGVYICHKCVRPRFCQEPAVAAQQAPRLDEAICLDNAERLQRSQNQHLAAYAERHGFAQPSAVGSSELPRNVERPSSFERFAQRFAERRAQREGPDELLSSNASSDEIVEAVKISVEEPVPVSVEEPLQIILSPFEPPLMNSTDFLVSASLILFVFSSLIYVVIRVAKTLLRIWKNHFVRIHSIENTSVSQEHPYHLVDPSPWPLLGSLGALTSTIGAVLYMHSFTGDKILLTLGLGLILYTMFVWWRDVTRESTYEGHHTKVVQLGLRYGFILFIVSEVMFFLAFFWAFFHSSLAPAVEIGAIWPPKGVEVLNSQGIPFLNTLILLLSGAAVTWAHHAILAGLKQQAVYALVATVWLALVFTGFQGMEYYEAPFTISDGIYGSTFFLATGFHGFHVIIGTIFLMICGIRQYIGHFSPSHHFGFEAAAWYWHFVDVVWLFLFISIYWWGGS